MQDLGFPYEIRLALPGGDGLGLGRYWHFATAPLWVICGICYVGTLFTSEQWRRLVPTSWEIFPCAWQTLLAYLELKSPEPYPPYTYTTGLPFNALQQLTYFGVIFILAPFQIITGATQSPAMLAHFPWIERLLGNRQSIRSLHFIGLVSFLGFFLVHLAMVFWHGFALEMDKMVLGRTHSHGSTDAVGWGVAIRSFAKHEKSDEYYYECVSMRVGRYPETILAYELNGEPLPLQHGAPVRPRFETKLGFKMVKFLRAIEVVDDYRRIGDGMGGVREDKQQFDMGAEI